MVFFKRGREEISFQIIAVIKTLLTLPTFPFCNLTSDEKKVFQNAGDVPEKMTERYKVEKSMYSIHVYMININCQHRTCLQKYEIEARVSGTNARC